MDAPLSLNNSQPRVTFCRTKLVETTTLSSGYLYQLSCRFGTII